MQDDIILTVKGWDAFGLPAENFAVESGTHPRDITRRNIGNIRRQTQDRQYRGPMSGRARRAARR